MKDSGPIAGAPMFWPAWGSDRVVHLARTEARRDRPPALYAVCPDGPRDELELVATPRWRLHRRRQWCEDCKAYGAYLKTRPTT